MNLYTVEFGYQTNDQREPYIEVHSFEVKANDPATALAKVYRKLKDIVEDDRVFQRSTVSLKEVGV